MFLCQIEKLFFDVISWWIGIWFGGRHSCFHHHICSLWMSFGVYVTGVLFQTASFVSFLLISHGYCITCERLSLTERRTTASLGCVFYLTLVGYRASVPYFAVSFFFTFFTYSLKLLFYLLTRWWWWINILFFTFSRCFWYLTTWSHSMLYSTTYHKTWRSYENS